MKTLLMFGLLLLVSVFAGDMKEIAAENMTDPVYQLPIEKYPRFSTELILKNGTGISFVSVKAMMNFYFHPEKYPDYEVNDRSEIDKMYVRDYVDGTRVDAREAWYVFGSRIAGPHGDDLIPLSSKTKAELFIKRYGGSRIMDADALTFGLIRYLDM